MHGGIQIDKCVPRTNRNHTQGQFMKKENTKGGKMRARRSMRRNRQESKKSPPLRKRWASGGQIETGGRISKNGGTKDWMGQALGRENRTQRNRQTTWPAERRTPKSYPNLEKEGYHPQGIINRAEMRVDLNAR